MPKIEIRSANLAKVVVADAGQELIRARLSQQIMNDETLVLVFLHETPALAAVEPGAVVRIEGALGEYRVLARSRDSRGQLTLQCEARWQGMRDVVSRRRNTDKSIDTTWEVIDRPILSTLTAILTEAPAAFQAGVIEAALDTAHPSVSIEFAAVTVQQAIEQLAAVIDAEWRWRAVVAPNGTRIYYLDLATEIVVAGARSIGDATSLSLQHEQHAREYASRIVPFVQTEEENAGIEDVRWKVLAVTFVFQSGMILRVIEIDGQLSSYTDMWKGFHVVQPERPSADLEIYLSEADAIYTILPSNAPLGSQNIFMVGDEVVIRTAAGDGVDYIPVNGADEDTNGISEELLQLEGSPAPNLLRKNGISDDMEGTLDADNLPPGWSKVGAPIVARVIDAAATITGTKVLRVTMNIGEGIQTSLADTSMAHHTSAWIAALIDSGEITLDMIDAEGKSYPEEIPGATVQDGRAAGLGASAPDTPTMLAVRITATQDNTVILLDAATLTPTAAHVEWMEIMGPSDIFDAGLDAVSDQSAHGIWHEVGGSTIDAGKIAGDDLELYAEVELRGWTYDGVNRVSLDTRVVEYYADLAADTLRPTVRLDRRRETLAEALSRVPRSVVPGAPPAAITANPGEPGILASRTDAGGIATITAQVIDGQGVQLPSYILEKSLDGADWVQVAEKGTLAADTTHAVDVTIPASGRTELRLRAYSHRSGKYSPVYTFYFTAAVSLGTINFSSITGEITAGQIARSMQQISSNIEFYRVASEPDRRLGWRPKTGSNIKLRYQDGTEYTITANSTGKNLATFDAVTTSRLVYIYFDPDVSTTDLQFTTDYSQVNNASGARILLAVTERAQTTAGFLYLVGYGVSELLVSSVLMQAVDLRAVSTRTGSLTVTGIISNATGDYEIGEDGIKIKSSSSSDPPHKQSLVFGAASRAIARLFTYTYLYTGGGPMDEARQVTDFYINAFGTRNFRINGDPTLGRNVTIQNDLKVRHDLTVNRVMWSLAHVRSQGGLEIFGATAPPTTTHRLYRVGDALMWNGAAIGGGSYTEGNGIKVSTASVISVNIDGAIDSQVGTATGSGLALGSNGLAHAGGNLTAGQMPSGTSNVLTRISIDRFGHIRNVNYSGIGTGLAFSGSNLLIESSYQLPQSGSGYLRRNNDTYSLQTGYLPPITTLTDRYLKTTGTGVEWSTVPAGPTGPAGPRGQQGSRGLIGPTGPAGVAGPRGFTGQAGTDGTAGATGQQGSRGLIGPTGPAGVAGPRGQAGTDGTAGATGQQGSRGLIGPTGPAGVAGPRGFTGQAGTDGTAGATGQQGSRGLIGPTGPAGVAGPRGQAGTDGTAGATGQQGSRGLIGPTGPAGVAGPRGFTGQAGTDGTAGATGQQGSRGLIGPTGPAGVAGPRGQAGTDGTAGATGQQGSRGLIGPTGPAGVAGPEGQDGPRGAAGSTGQQGSRGLIGPTGPAGVAGPEGQDGPRGAAGSTGQQGSRGLTGAAGTDGGEGSRGATGAPGTRGATGSIGATGPRGLTGAAGTDGGEGARGATGAPGTRGSRGLTGPRGLTGAAGTDGGEGSRGATGATGSRGPRGARGATGSSALVTAPIQYYGSYIGLNYSDAASSLAGTGLTASGGTLNVSGSDRRLKRNIREITDALSVIDKIRSVGFAWVRDQGLGASTRSYGVIAQEIEAVLPDVVTHRSDGMRYVHYPALTAYALAGVKELKNYVNTMMVLHRSPAKASIGARTYDIGPEAALAGVAALRAYTWREGSRYRFDLDADQMLDIDPRLVRKSDSGVSMDKMDMIPYLAAAMSEVKRRLDAANI